MMLKTKLAAKIYAYRLSRRAGYPSSSPHPRFSERSDGRPRTTAASATAPSTPIRLSLRRVSGGEG